MLAELSTYSLQDFLLFDAAIYRDLFGQLNEDLWPLPLAGIALALLLLALRTTRPALAERGAMVLLAAASLTSAWFFFFGVYETINFAAVYPGWSFVAEAGLLVLAAIRSATASGPSRQLKAAPPWSHGLAHLVVLYGLFGHPAAEWAAGRAWANLEWFALAPDPTALAALGFLAFWRSPWRYALAIVPVVWLAASALTLHGLSAEVEALCLALATLAGLAAVLMPRQKAVGLVPRRRVESGAGRQAVPAAGGTPRFPGRKAIGGQALLPTTRRQ